MNMFSKKNQQFGTKRAREAEESECALLCRRRKSASFSSCRSLRFVRLRLAVGTLKFKDGRSSCRRCSVLFSTLRRLHARSSQYICECVLRVRVWACACVRAYVRTCAWRVCRNKLKVEPIDKVKLPDALTNSCPPGIDTQRNAHKTKTSISLYMLPQHSSAPMPLGDLSMETKLSTAVWSN